MSKSPDAVLLALIATLEDRAKKKGEKSIVKSLVGRLEKGGAGNDLIGEISALRATKIREVEPAAKKPAAAKPNGKVKAAATKASKQKAAEPQSPIVAG